MISPAVGWRFEARRGVRGLSPPPPPPPAPPPLPPDVFGVVGSNTVPPWVERYHGGLSVGRAPASAVGSGAVCRSRDEHRPSRVAGITRRAARGLNSSYPEPEFRSFQRSQEYSKHPDR